jgi:hypothetical protein
VGNQQNPTLNEVCDAAVFLIENCPKSVAFVGDFAAMVLRSDRRQPKTLDILADVPDAYFDGGFKGHPGTRLLRTNTKGNPQGYLIESDGFRVPMNVIVARNNHLGFPASLENQSTQKYVSHVDRSLPLLSPRILLAQKVHQLYQWDDQHALDEYKAGIEDLRTFLEASFSSGEEPYIDGEAGQLYCKFIRVFGRAVFMGLSVDGIDKSRWRAMNIPPIDRKWNN